MSTPATFCNPEQDSAGEEQLRYISYFQVLIPIFHPMKMPRILRIMEDLEEETFRLGTHISEAGLEMREKFINVLRSDGNADMEADAMECLQIG